MSRAVDTTTLAVRLLRNVVSAAACSAYWLLQAFHLLLQALHLWASADALQLQFPQTQSDLFLGIVDLADLLRLDESNLISTRDSLPAGGPAMRPIPALAPRPPPAHDRGLP